MPKPPHKQRGQHPQQSIPQQQPQQHQVSVQKVQQVQWSGPLPPPEALEKFNNVLPNGADRIVRMAELEQTHRHDYEKSGLVATTAEAKRGQYLGALLSIIAMAATVYSAAIGAHWVVSTCLGGITLLGLVRAIVRPRGNGKPEKPQKNQ